MKEIKSSQNPSEVKGNNQCQDRKKSRDVACGKTMWVTAVWVGKGLRKVWVNAILRKKQLLSPIIVQNQNALRMDCF